MDERRREHRKRTFRSGKLVFNDRRSVIDCIVRNLSDAGACLELSTTTGIPHRFDLYLDGSDAGLTCQVIWLSEKRAGVEFRQPIIAHHSNAQPSDVIASPPIQPQDADTPDPLRSELLSLRMALDEVPVGIVLLDADTRAQFINRAFRRMWRLPDAKADSAPPFVALMYHGRDTLAYRVPAEDMDAYVAARVAHVKVGDPTPLDLRLASGEVIRAQCTALPDGGRMLCYTYVTDIVRHSDELDLLRGALDQMQVGIILLDEFLNAQFLNRAVRKLWNIPDAVADRKPSYVEMVGNGAKDGCYGIPAHHIREFMVKRVAMIRSGDPTPVDIPHADGRTIRSQCAALPNGGRMLIYTEVTDLVERARGTTQKQAVNN